MTLRLSVTAAAVATSLQSARLLALSVRVAWQTQMRLPALRAFHVGPAGTQPADKCLVTHAPQGRQIPTLRPPHRAKHV